MDYIYIYIYIRIFRRRFSKSFSWFSSTQSISVKCILRLIQRNEGMNFKRMKISKFELLELFFLTFSNNILMSMTVHNHRTYDRSLFMCSVTGGPSAWISWLTAGGSHRTAEPSREKETNSKRQTPPLTLIFLGIFVPCPPTWKLLFSSKRCSWKFDKVNFFPLFMGSAIDFRLVQVLESFWLNLLRLGHMLLYLLYLSVLCCCWLFWRYHLATY